MLQWPVDKLNLPGIKPGRTSYLPDLINRSKVMPCDDVVNVDGEPVPALVNEYRLAVCRQQRVVLPCGRGVTFCLLWLC